MKAKNWILTSLTLFIGLGFLHFRSMSSDISSEINLVASTPCDEQIKSILALSPNSVVDFVRWDLILKNAKTKNSTFTLKIVYGESQPNTLGFKNNGETKYLEGECKISQFKKGIYGEVYHLISEKLTAEILIVKLNDNIFHLLTPEKQLMVGNGGWSYTLNRKEPIDNTSVDLPALTILSDLPLDTARQIIFDGRTPCLDFAKENNLTVASDCFKLKWKLILNKDPKTLLPTVYTLHRTNSRENLITGKWRILKGTSSNPGAVIYQLDPDKPDRSISLLLGDENVAFFIHKDNNLFTGNENFSYTLNKRQKH
jgi:hypothetical protein